MEPIAQAIFNAVDSLPQALQVAAEAVVRHIKGRTLTGRDITGAPFAPYSPSTVAQGKGSAQPVNLRDRGQMMRDMVVGGTGNRREVFLATARSNLIGTWHMTGTRSAGGRQKLPQRLWFGITQRYSGVLFMQIASTLQTTVAGAGSGSSETVIIRLGA